MNDSMRTLLRFVSDGTAVADKLCRKAKMEFMGSCPKRGCEMCAFVHRLFYTTRDLRFKDVRYPCRRVGGGGGENILSDTPTSAVKPQMHSSPKQQRMHVNDLMNETFLPI